MNVLTFSEARASLKTVMDNVCKDHTPTIVSRVSGEHVVMMSLADFNSMKETMYLLSSPANANHLMESIAQLRAGQAQPRELICHEKPKKQKQTASENGQPLMDTECVG
jgi:antitoxin YefM